MHQTHIHECGILCRHKGPLTGSLTIQVVVRDTPPLSGLPDFCFGGPRPAPPARIHMAPPARIHMYTMVYYRHCGRPTSCGLSMYTLYGWAYHAFKRTPRICENTKTTNMASFCFPDVMLQKKETNRNQSKTESVSQPSLTYSHTF